MSRTYRRRRYRQLWSSGDPLTDWFASDDNIVWEDVEEVKYSFGWSFRILPRYNVEYKADSKTGRKLIAKARSDAATWKCKEPGPGWFRNLYVTRPLRRQAKNEIRKYIKSIEKWDYPIYNDIYEPMILTDPPLPYWT